jgi:predicted secreted protein
MIECPRFCPDCPLTPSGVEVEVVSVRLEAPYEAAMFDDNREPSIASIRSVAVEVDTKVNSRVEVGDESQILVDIDGRTGTKISQAIDKCDGPKRAFKIGRKVCSSVTRSRAT